MMNGGVCPVLPMERASGVHICAYHDVKYGWYFKPNFIKRVAENCEQKRTGARCEGVWRKAGCPTLVF